MRNLSSSVLQDLTYPSRPVVSQMEIWLQFQPAEENAQGPSSAGWRALLGWRLLLSERMTGSPAPRPEIHPCTDQQQRVPHANDSKGSAHLGM